MHSKLRAILRLPLAQVCGGIYDIIPRFQVRGFGGCVNQAFSLAKSQPKSSWQRLWIRFQFLMPSAMSIFRPSWGEALFALRLYKILKVGVLHVCVFANFPPSPIGCITGLVNLT